MPIYMDSKRYEPNDLSTLGFSTTTIVRVYNCPGLTALPELPAATHVRVANCPGLTAKY